MTYNNPTPVAVALVRIRRADRSLALLGVVRAHAPGIGGLAFPGGYVDEMETIEQAATRELVEETGLHTDPSEWRLLRSMTTPQNRVLVFCELRRELPESVLGTLLVNEEVSGFACLDESSELVFPTHQGVLRAYLERESAPTRILAVSN